MTVYQAVRQFGEQTDADTDTETPLGEYSFTMLAISVGRSEVAAVKK